MSEISLPYRPPDREAEVRALAKSYRRRAWMQMAVDVVAGAAVAGVLAIAIFDLKSKQWPMPLVLLPGLLRSWSHGRQRDWELIQIVLRSSHLSPGARKLALEDFASALPDPGVAKSEEPFDWELLARLLREMPRGLLRLKIMGLATKMGRTEFLPVIEKLYQKQGLGSKKIDHSEATALTQARLILRSLGDEPGATQLWEEKV